MKPLPDNNENAMKQTSQPVSFRTLAAVLVFCAAGFCLPGCEGHETVGEKIVDAVKGNDKQSDNLSGTWTGTSGSGHYQTTVSVVDNNGVLSGSLQWSWGGVRKFSGTRSGSAVVWTTKPDSEGVRDTWSMTLSSDRKRLTGHASKSDGGGYAVSLSR